MNEMFSKLLEVRMSIWIILGIVSIFSIIALVVLHKNKNSRINTSHTKKIVYGGLCISISFVLSYIRIWHMPLGGSITLASMLPLVLFSFVFGPLVGIVAGVAYGFLQLLQNPSIVHWAQLLLDYPIAFGLLGLAGIVPEKYFSVNVRFGIGIFIGIFGRGIMHILSGAIFFKEYAGDMNPWLYSISYNMSYLSVELVITLALGLAIASTSVYKLFKKSIYS